MRAFYEVNGNSVPLPEKPAVCPSDTAASGDGFDFKKRTIACGYSCLAHFDIFNLLISARGQNRFCRIRAVDICKCEKLN